jgi:hypothetical protein
MVRTALAGKVELLGELRGEDGREKRHRPKCWAEHVGRLYAARQRRGTVERSGQRCANLNRYCVVGRIN